MIVARVTDLMDRSRFPAGVRFVRRLDPDAAGPEVTAVVVDLGVPGALDDVRALRERGSTARVVAYGSHVERDLLAEARAAGCDRVLARSAFFGDVASHLP